MGFSPPPEIVSGGLKFPIEGSKEKGEKRKKKKKEGKIGGNCRFNVKFFKNFSKFRGASPPEPPFAFSNRLFHQYKYKTSDCTSVSSSLSLCYDNDYYSCHCNL